MKTPQVKAFLEWIFDAVFEGHDLEGGETQDKAEELGLLVRVKIPQAEIDANPEKYEYCLEYDTDELYFPFWTEEAITGAVKP